MSNRNGRKAATRRLTFEQVEERLVLTGFGIWSGDINTDFNDARNWDGDAPAANVDVVFNIEATAATAPAVKAPALNGNETVQTFKVLENTTELNLNTFTLNTKEVWIAESIADATLIVNGSGTWNTDGETFGIGTTVDEKSGTLELTTATLQTGVLAVEFGDVTFIEANVTSTDVVLNTPEGEAKGNSTADVSGSNWTITGNLTVNLSGRLFLGLGDITVSGTTRTHRAVDEWGLIDVAVGTLTLNGAATLDGELNVVAGGTVKLYGDGTNNGSIVVNAGTIDMASHELTQAGTIHTGDFVGKFLLDGDMEQTAAGTTIVKIGGTQGVGDFTKHDVFIINDGVGGGILTLNGKLEVQLIDPEGGVLIPEFFNPEEGDKFSIIRANEAFVGEFSEEELPALDAGEKWHVYYESVIDDGVGLDDSAFEVLLVVVKPDLLAKEFRGDGGGGFAVEYEVDSDDPTYIAPSFTISIYASNDGITPTGSALQPVPVEEIINRTRGTHVIPFTPTFAIPTDTYLIAAIDTDNVIEEFDETNNALAIIAPDITTLGGGHVTRGDTLTLTATASDIDGQVTNVEFYDDVNGSKTLDAGDVLLHTDDDASNGFSANLSTAAYALGTKRFLAQATDNHELRSAVFAGEVDIWGYDEDIIDDRDGDSEDNYANGHHRYEEQGSVWVDGVYEGWRDGALSGGYDGQYRPHQTGSASDKAIFNFEGLAPGSYEVWGTWREYTNRATDVPFTIYDHGSAAETIEVNQQQAPVGLTTGGSIWRKLTTVNVTSGMLKVELSGDAQHGPPGSDQGAGPYDDAIYFIADAIRIVRADSGATGDASVADDGNSGGNSGYAETGSGWSTGSQTGGVRGDYRVAAAGTGTNTATWSFSGVEEGTYRVWATWTAFANRATNAPFTLLTGGVAQLTAAVNQQAAPAGQFALGSQWKSVGVLHVSGGALDVRLTNNANGYVVADSVRIERISDIVIDNKDGAYSETGGDWTNGALTSSYRGTYRVNTAGAGTSTANWTVGNLEPGTYGIYATWVQNANRATNAPFTISDGSGLNTTVQVNQRIAPNDLVDYGVSWELLGTFTVAGNTLTITLSDNANGYVIADALLIRPAG